jgi:hypothetical protein
MTAAFGIAYHAADVELEVTPGAQTVVELRLQRALDLGPWRCGDFHVHSAPRFDCDVAADQRLIAAAAEGLDLFVATDHNVLTDWQPVLSESGLGALVVLPGVEVTPDVWAIPEYIGHFNLFPLSSDFDPSQFEREFFQGFDMSKRARAQNPHPVIIQVNHPRSSDVNGLFITTGFDPHDRAHDDAVLSFDFDTLEAFNGREITYYNLDHTWDVLQDWFKLLNAGKRVVATGGSDTHGLASSIFGYPRNCVRTDRDTAFSGTFSTNRLIDALRAGQVEVTSGPFIDATLEGCGPGQPCEVSGAGMLSVTVSAPNWAPVDRLGVVVNGDVVTILPVDALPFTADIPLSFTRDSWLVVWVDAATPARGPLPAELSTPLPSMAFTNPIFIDADGDGQYRPPAR